MLQFVKLFGAVVLAVGIIMLGRLILLGKSSADGTANGLVDSQLSPCPSSLNCVSSDTSQEDASYIEPLPYPIAGKSALLLVIESTGGELVTDEDGYIAATYTIPVFGFVDDVEFRMDATNSVIHVRSESRTGTSDLGVNRKRVEKIREAILQF